MKGNNRVIIKQDKALNSKRTRKRKREREQREITSEIN
jgi:hypothetical protein